MPEIPPPRSLSIHPLAGIPLVEVDDDLPTLLLEALAAAGLEAADGDALVVAQKIVSKAEGRLVRLGDVEPSAEAIALAATVKRDPRMVQLILQESVEVVRRAPGVLIVRNRLGIIGANAGIDQSNIDHRGEEWALLLPEDPDRSARELRAELQRRTGRRLGVVISDSANRPWRLGTIGVAIGCAGITVLDDRRGHTDLFGRELQVTVSNRADSIATAALLVMGETTEAVPAALVRGLPPGQSNQSARDALRPAADDLFL